MDRGATWCQDPKNIYQGSTLQYYESSEKTYAQIALLSQVRHDQIQVISQTRWWELLTTIIPTESGQRE